MGLVLFVGIVGLAVLGLYLDRYFDTLVAIVKKLQS